MIDRAKAALTEQQIAAQDAQQTATTQKDHVRACALAMALRKLESK